jgi:uncharacterized protein (DUF1697 family)
MATLKKMFERMKFTEVKTLLASGNVVFEAPAMPVEKLTSQLEKEFEKTFGFTSKFILRPMSAIQKLVDSAPFKKITVTKDTRLYVSFLSEKEKSTLKIPYVSPEKDFEILSKTDAEVCSVLTVIPGQGTPKAMEILEKEFGKNITTRNWNTVIKLLK